MSFLLLQKFNSRNVLTYINTISNFTFNVNGYGKHFDILAKQIRNSRNITKSIISYDDK